MTKSKKQFAAQQTQTQTQTQTKTKTKAQPQAQAQSRSTGDDFGRTIELAFVDHPWPASRGELIEHAGRHGTFAKSDLARLKRIPHREYHSITDLMNATREVEMAMAQGPGPVTTPERNRRAMGETSPNAQMHSATPFEDQSR